MHVLRFPLLPKHVYDSIDYPDDSNCTDLVQCTQKEIDGYYDAAKECFKMIDEATDYVIKNNMLSDIGIPPYMHRLIEHTFNNSAIHPHMIGRFDFAGGLDNAPIKLIEFNGDTPFTLFESSALQYAIAKLYNLNPDEYQFNELYSSLKDFFSYLSTETKKDIHPCFLRFNYLEDITNMNIVKWAADEILKDKSGPAISWEELAIEAERGICQIDKNSHVVDAFNVIIKMIPWDIMISNDPFMAAAICNVCEDYLDNYQYDIVFANPIYSLVYQSKALYPIMCQLFPDSPYLLDTFADCPRHLQKYVTKPIFGREGQNIKIFENDTCISSIEGYYDKQPVIYQEFTNFNTHEEETYQPGVFISMETPCCLSFRRTRNKVISCDDQICGNIIKG